MRDRPSLWKLCYLMAGHAEISAGLSELPCRIAIGNVSHREVAVDRRSQLCLAFALEIRVWYHALK